MDTAKYLDRKGKVICGLDPAEAAQLIDELMAAQISGEIDVVGPDEEFRLKHPPEECGFSCQINRVFLGFGNDMEEFEWERNQLRRGQAIVAVPAGNPELQEKVRQIMAGHCHTSLHFYGKWTTKEM